MLIKFDFSSKTGILVVKFAFATANLKIETLRMRRRFARVFVWYITLSPGQTIATFQRLLPSFGHVISTCCNILRAENRTIAHARVQHCCTNLTKRLQHHATSTNLTIFKFEPTTPNMSQHIATLRNRVAKRTQHVAPTMLKYNLVLSTELTM